MVPALGHPAASRCVRIVDDPRHDRDAILLARLDDRLPFAAPADDTTLLTAIFLHDQNLFSSPAVWIDATGDGRIGIVRLPCKNE